MAIVKMQQHTGEGNGNCMECPQIQSNQGNQAPYLIEPEQGGEAHEHGSRAVAGQEATEGATRLLLCCEFSIIIHTREVSTRGKGGGGGQTGR